ncbi:unnamed protein product [Paramecium octaurelia]|uniref:Protein kinase domain-containing protein n=1 Tax=Paramecium octaurelia TaxID=43137 RepID=A0A8S1V1A2_PAROT|nr:unnamed protein product [Paramecium octaurelia]
MLGWTEKYQTNDKNFFTNDAKSTYAIRVSDKLEVCLKKFDTSRSEYKEYLILEDIYRNKHNNIINVLDVHKDQFNYIVMEKYSNNLQEQIKRQEHVFQIEQIFDFLRQIIKGYKHLMEQGIFHRNLNPQTIYYIQNNKDIIYKIGGFDHSKRLEDLDCQVEDCTKQLNRGYYQAFEQTVYSYCYKSDIYSLGLILYEMVTKSKLQNLKELSEKKLENICNLDNIDNRLKQLLREMIVHQSESRLTWTQLIKLMFYQTIETFKENEKAKSLETNQNVFIKGIKKSIKDNKFCIGGKEKEELKINRLLKGAEFINIVKVHEVLNEPESSKIYIIMEDCEGSLEDLLKTKEFKVEEILDLVSQINDGYNFLEQSKIIHRDIKPENILYKTDQGKIIYKIADFGISRLDIQGCSKCGTNLYVAPEVIGLFQYSNKCDIYSLGILIYYVATRRKYPFDDKNPKVFINLLQHNQSIEHCYPQDVVLDESIKQLINKMIVYDPDARVAWGQQLKVLIEALQKQIKLKKIEFAQIYNQQAFPNSNIPLTFHPINNNFNQLQFQRQNIPQINNNIYNNNNNNFRLQNQPKSDIFPRNQETPRSISIADRPNYQITPKSNSDNNKIGSFNGQKIFIQQNQIQQGNQFKQQHNFNTQPSQPQFNRQIQNNQTTQKFQTIQNDQVKYYNQTLQNQGPIFNIQQNINYHQFPQNQIKKENF